MYGWIRRRTASLLRSLGKLVEPEIARSEPVERAPVIPAVRGWSLRRGSAEGPPLLSSLIVSYEWRSPVVRTGKPSPVPGSLSYSRNSEPRPDIGFFALKPDRSRDVLERYPSLVCVGTVSLFGRVVEHEYGYRAEWMRVDSLWVVEEMLGRDRKQRSEEVTEYFRQRYRCDAHVVPTVGRAVESAVQAMPRSLP